MTLDPGSKIRYLLADGKEREMGFLDGHETPDFTRFEERLREGEEARSDRRNCSLFFRRQF